MIGIIFAASLGFIAAIIVCAAFQRFDYLIRKEFEGRK